MVILDNCRICGCNAAHRPDSCHPLDWCPDCLAACWHPTPKQPVPVAAPMVLGSATMGRVAAPVIDILNDTISRWIGAAVGL